MLVTTVGITFAPQVVSITTGSTVTWQFNGTHAVVFAGLAPSGGDVPVTGPGNSVSRVFNQPGTYDYICSRHQGMSGRVQVTGVAQADK